MTEATILVVGANGNLGHRIVDALLARPEPIRIRAGVQKPEEHRDLVDRWAIAGVAVMRCDVDDAASLDAACEGVTTVVSAVSGLPERVGQSQDALLAACERQGVERMVPSDFALNLFALEDGESPNMDVRRAFDRRLEASSVGHTFFLNGGFMEAMSSPFIGMLNAEEGTVDLWGDGNDPLDLTAMDDGAAFLAAALVHPDTIGRTIEVVGDRRTGREVAEDYEAATGTPMRFRSKGSIADGYARLDKLKEEGTDFYAIFSLQAVLPMLSGKARLNDPANALFPDVQPMTYRMFLSQQASPR